MEPRRVNGKITGITKPSQQSARWMSCRSSLKPPMLKTAFAGPDAAGRPLRAHADWLHPARQLANCCFPTVAVSRLQTLPLTIDSAPRSPSPCPRRPAAVTTTPPALLPARPRLLAREQPSSGANHAMLVSLPVRPRLLTLSP